MEKCSARRLTEAKLPREVGLRTCILSLWGKMQGYLNGKRSRVTRQLLALSSVRLLATNRLNQMYPLCKQEIGEQFSKIVNVAICPFPGPKFLVGLRSGLVSALNSERVLHFDLDKSLEISLLSVPKNACH